MRIRVVCGLALALAAALAILQSASASIFSSAGTPVSFPANVPRAFGVRVYELIEPIAPLSFVESMLARAALEDGDVAAAQGRVNRMAPSVEREELLARIALARGDHRAAMVHFLGAADINALDAEVDRLYRAHRTAEAYKLEGAARERLASTSTHPDAVAESFWRSGELATAKGYENPTQRKRWFAIGLDDYRQALVLSPFSEKFLLAAGTQSMDLQQDKLARNYFARGVDVNPASAQAYAGLGIIALHSGDRAAAERYAVRSRSIDRNAGLVQRLERELR